MMIFRRKSVAGCIFRKVLNKIHFNEEKMRRIFFILTTFFATFFLTGCQNDKSAPVEKKAAPQAVQSQHETRLANIANLAQANANPLPTQKYQVTKSVKSRTSKELTDEATKYMAYVDKMIAETIPLIEQRGKISPHDEKNAQLTSIIIGNIKAMREKQDLSPISNCQLVGEFGANVLSDVLSYGVKNERVAQSQKAHNDQKGHCQRDINGTLEIEPVRYILTDAKVKSPAKDCSKVITFAKRDDGKQQWECPVK